MKIAIVYDSRTGTTKALAESMAGVVADAGHEPAVSAVQDASAADVSDADAVCVGSWTEGLFFILQHATKETMGFIDRLDLQGKPAAVFCTYKTADGRMLDKMTDAMEARGASVTGRFRSKSAAVPDDFARWVGSLQP